MQRVDSSKASERDFFPRASSFFCGRPRAWALKAPRLDSGTQAPEAEASERSWRSKILKESCCSASRSWMHCSSGLKSKVGETGKAHGFV